MAPRHRHRLACDGDERGRAGPQGGRNERSARQLDRPLEVFVPDRYEAAEWYRGAMGLKVVEEWERMAVGGGPLMISADGGKTMLVLFEGKPRGSRETAGHHRVAFRVDGASFLKFVEDSGRAPVYDDEGRETASGRLMDHEKTYSVYFCDPWGYRYELTTYDRDEVAARLGAKS